MELFPQLRSQATDVTFLEEKQAIFLITLRRPQAAFEMFAECVECLQAEPATVLSRFYSAGLRQWLQ